MMNMQIDFSKLKGHNKNIAKLISIILMVLGCIFIFAGIGIAIFLFYLDKSMPDDVQWYKATVAEVVKVDEKLERTNSSNKRNKYRTTYDCEVYLEYEVEGELQKIDYTINGSYENVRTGDEYYVKVSPSDPTKIHVFSKEPDDSMIEIIGPIVLAVFGIIAIIGSIIVKKSAKDAKVVEKKVDYSGTSIDKLD